MADRQRQTNRINYRGLNTRLLPDAIPVASGKVPCGINVRADGDSKARTRPGYAIVKDSGFTGFTTGGIPITDLRAMTTLGTDNKPRIVVHDSGGGVWLDNGVKQGTVGTGSLGASLIPFRPNQSPQSWMYICNGTGYQKFQAPNSSNVMVQQKVGIAEPQSPPDACPDGLSFNDFSSTHASWTQGGTAGGPSDATRSTDTAVAIFQDPASVAPATRIRYSVQVGTTSYGIGETLNFAKLGGGGILSVVEDVFPPINGGTALTIESILYLFGPAGRCVIVPSQLQIGSNNQENPSPGISFLPGQLAGLRRGSLIQIGAEVVLVLMVTAGPQGQLAFECSPQFTHVAGETIIGVPAIAVAGLSSLVVGQTVTSAQINSTIATGVGTLTQTLSPNPFNLSLGTIGTPQEDDHIHVSVAMDVPLNVTEFKIQFDVGDGSFTQNVLYYSIAPSVLQGTITNTQTQLAAVQGYTQQDLIRNLSTGGTSPGGSSPSATDVANQQAFDILSPNEIPTNDFGNLPSGEPSLGPKGPAKSLIFDVTATSPAAPGMAATGANQFTEAIFPITALSRIGNDQTKTLANCVKVQILVNTTGSLALQFGSIWVGGGGQPDLGDNVSANPVSSGAPYIYRVRPRSSLTGALGNPSPATRYGVEPHRQRVIVSLPSATYDPQIDTWDIFRYGGTVTSYRFVGSATSTSATFVDNVFDDAALAGDPLDFDNFEPWPTVDVPYSANSGITVYGTALEIVGGTFPATITRWLPGTLITLNGQLTYTLWNRPIAITGGYLFRTIENMGAPTVTTVQINEPDVANQNLPYLWGPDANGIVFGAGDPLRPGVLYSAKQNNPDSTPNNVYDLVQPGEPLMGGEIVDGLALVSSSRRWWQLQAALSTPQRWNPVETPAGRGLAAPYGSCTDGKFIYFWAKDGIYSMIPGLPAISLTEVDLGNLFPTVDDLGNTTIAKDVTYAGFTFFAPDYSRILNFRLSVSNSILRAHYRDEFGFARTMTLDMSVDSAGQQRMAWTSDIFADSILNSYQAEQPTGSLLVPGTAYPQVYFADAVGQLYTEQDLANDNGTPITSTLITPEWDAGDARTQKQWEDAWVDCIPVSGMTVASVVGGVSGMSFLLGPSSVRTLPPSIGSLGHVIGNFCGLLFTWTDDFDTQSAPTQLFEWSNEFVTQPLLISSWQSVPTSHGQQGYHFVYRIRFAYRTAGANSVTLILTAYDGTSPQTIIMPGTNGQYQKTEFVPTFNKGLLYTYQAASSGQWAPILEDTEVLVGAWQRVGPCAVFTGLGGAEAQ